MHHTAAGGAGGSDDEERELLHLHRPVQGVAQHLPAAPVAGGHADLDDALDRAVVVEARRLRRRLRLLARVLRALLLLGGVGSCAASIFVPNVLRFTCRSQQSEARGNLKALYVAEESYRADFDRYTDDPAGVGGYEVKGAKIRYAYAVTDVDDDGFVAWAFRRDGEREDVWRIDESGTVENVLNGCVP